MSLELRRAIAFHEASAVDILAGAGVPVVPSPATGKGREAVLWPLIRGLPSASGVTSLSGVTNPRTPNLTAAELMNALSDAVVCLGH